VGTRVGCPDTLGSNGTGVPDFACDGGMMRSYLFIGGPYHGTYQDVDDGCAHWNLPEPRSYPTPCCRFSEMVETVEPKFTMHTYRKLPIHWRGFTGNIFVKADLTNDQAIDLFLELKRM
jgi:hypothetical protein